MKKRLLILGGIILLAIILIIVVYILKNQSTDQWKIYENSRYQFSLNYPSDWQLGEEPTNHDGMVFSSPDGKKECRAYGFNNVLTGTNNQPQSLNEYIDWLISNDVRVISKKQSKLGDHEAIQLVTEEGSLISEAIYALGKESGRGLVCTFGNALDQQNFSLTFEAMTASFKIKANLDG